MKRADCSERGPAPSMRREGSHTAEASVLIRKVRELLRLRHKPRANGVGNGADFGQHARGVIQAAVHVDHDVADLGVGLAVLGGDVDASLSANASLSRPRLPGTLRCTWMKRVPEDRGGSSTCGKFTAPVVEPLSEYSTNLRATSAPMRSCASSVEPPMCGVRMTLSRPCSGADELARNSSRARRGTRRRRRRPGACP